MMETILFVGYLLTCLWGFRFAAGAYVYDMTPKGHRVSGEDFMLGMLIGVIGALISPAMLPARIVYVVWRKHLVDNPMTDNVIHLMFPAPKEIETKREKRERLERERAEEIANQRKEINRRERELGLEVTRW